MNFSIKDFFIFYVVTREETYKKCQKIKNHH